MSIDMAALKALVGEALVSLDGARRALDETGATAADLGDQELVPLWLVIEERIRARRELDSVTIAHSLAKSPKLKTAALGLFVSPELGRGSERLEILRTESIHRQLIERLRLIAAASKARQSLSDIETMLRATPDVLRGTTSRVRNLGGSALAMLDEYEEAWAGKRKPLLTTGLGDLDEEIRLNHTLIILGARMGVGKSALVAGLIDSWTGRGIRTGLLCYEDQERDLEWRLIARRSGVPLGVARSDLPSNEYQRGEIANALEHWSSREQYLDIDDARPTGNLATVLASIRRMRDNGCEAVILDNMTCVRMGEDGELKNLEIERALSDIRGEAQRLKIPIIVVGHIKRGTKTEDDEAERPPRLSDFSASGAWENYARLALGMWREGNRRFVKVLKQTNGPDGAEFELEMALQAGVITGSKKHFRAPPMPMDTRREPMQRKGRTS